MRHVVVDAVHDGGHSPQGECGLKCFGYYDLRRLFGHSPQGECGLKFHTIAKALKAEPVTPRKGSAD